MLNAGLLPLRSDRTVLRAMRPSDAAAYAAGTADPAVRRYAHLPEPEYTEGSVVALIHGAISDGLERGDLAVLTIADPATDAFAGSMVLFGAAEGSAEVGFWVHPDHRGKGIAAEAVAAAVEFARRSGVARLTARTVRDNQASRRTLERTGFTQGETTSDVAPSGQEIALTHYLLDLEQEADAVSDILDAGPFFHGTKAQLQPGDLLTAGFRSNYRPEVVMNHIYFTALPDGAGLAAEVAALDDTPHVYEVEPTGAFENDPNVTDKKFPGNPTRSYRSTEPLRVVREVTDWTRLTPEARQSWRERLAALRDDDNAEIIN